MSLALAHKKRVLAEKAKQQQAKTAKTETRNHAMANSGKTSNVDTDLKQQINNDIAILKALNGDEERIPYKKELIEKYRPLCEELMQSHKNWAGLNVLFNWFIWRLDVEGIEAMQDDLKLSLDNGLTTPTAFKRDWQSVYLDAVHDYTAKALTADKTLNKDLIKQAITDLNTGNLITNGALKSKLYALHGKILFAENDKTNALASLEKAHELNNHAGVKKLINEIKKEIEENGKK